MSIPMEVTRSLTRKFLLFYTARRLKFATAGSLTQINPSADRWYISHWRCWCASSLSLSRTQTTIIIIFKARQTINLPFIIEPQELIRLKILSIFFLLLLQFNYRQRKTSLDEISSLMLIYRLMLIAKFYVFVVSLNFIFSYCWNLYTDHDPWEFLSPPCPFGQNK